MGSVVGTIKDSVDKNKKIGILKIKTYRPFPAEDIVKIINKAKYIAVLDKAITLGHIGPLANDIKSVAQGKVKAKIQSFIVGLGGRDITSKMIKKIINEIKNGNDETRFIG